MKSKCPFCKKEQIKKPVKEWKYNKGIVNVSLYNCECGKNFRYYKSEYTEWTIPKKNKS